MKTIDTSRVSTDQIDELEGIARGVPEELRYLLTSIVTSLRDGDKIVAVDSTETLTPNQAAKHLGMSRTHLYKLLDNGTIEFRRVGRDRRITVADLGAFTAQRDAERRQLAERFACQDRIREAAVQEIADLL